MRFSQLLWATTSVALALTLPSRPPLSISPKSPSTPLSPSPPRDPSRLCTVDPSAADAGAELVRAATECNDGGTVVFSPNTTYTITTPTDLRFLKHIDVAILGTVKFSEDVEWWQTHWLPSHLRYA